MIVSQQQSRVDMPTKEDLLEVLSIMELMMEYTNMSIIAYGRLAELRKKLETRVEDTL